MVVFVSKLLQPFSKKKIIKNQLTLIFILLNLSLLSAQVDTMISEVYFRITTATPYQVKIGDSVYQDIKRMTLPKGEQRFQVWAPGYSVLDTVIDVQKRHFGFTQDLVALPDYAAYQVELGEFDKRIKYARVPWFVAVPTAAFMIDSYNKAEDYYVEAKDLLNVYYNEAPYYNGVNITRTADIRDKYETARDNYEKYYNRYYLSAGITGVMTISGIVLTSIYNKKKRPVYEGDKSSPFTMTDWRIDVIDRTPVVSLSFTF